MNDSINSVMSVHKYMIKNCKSKITIMRPNQEWDGISEVNNDESIKYWNRIYENIENLNYHKEPSTVADNKLIEKSENYINTLKEKNNFFIIKILRLIGFFKDI